MKISVGILHQVITSANHGIGLKFHTLFSAGLNYQIEHHLFPNVNHYYYDHTR